MYSVKTAANQNSTDTINRKRNPNTVSLYDSLLKSSHFKKTFLKTAYFPTEVLQLLVVLPGLHLQVELMLIRAELLQILRCLQTVRLKHVLDPVRCVLEANLLFL